MLMFIRSALLAFALTSVPAALAQTESQKTYTIDSAHSYILVEVTRFGIPFVGRFNQFSGTITFDPTDLTKSTVNVSVDTNSVDTNSSRLDTHLNSTDFFNSAQFPSATFQSTNITSSGSDAYKITGNLTIAGKTQPVTLDAEFLGTKVALRNQNLLGATGEFAIDRTDFGITYLPNVIGSDVTVSVSLSAIEQ